MEIAKTEIDPEPLQDGLKKLNQKKSLQAEQNPVDDNIVKQQETHKLNRVGSLKFSDNGRFPEVNKNTSLEASRLHSTIQRRKSLNDLPISPQGKEKSNLARLTYGWRWLGSLSDDDTSTQFPFNNMDSDSDTDEDYFNAIGEEEDVKQDENAAREEENKKPEAAPILPRSDTIIRKDYLASLGIGSQGPRVVNDSTMGVHARRAAMASARARRRPPSMKIRLKDSEKRKAGFGQSLLRKISSWMTTEEENKYKASSRVVKDKDEARELRSIMQEDGERHVYFLDETDVHFVPSRYDISPRNRARLWHTREEFVDMVVKNMDQVEEEMKRKTEARRRLEDLKRNPPPSWRHKKKSTKR